MIKSIIIGIIILGLLTFFIIVFPSNHSYLAMALGVSIAIIILINYIASASTKKNYIQRSAIWLPIFSLSTFFFVLPIAFAGILNYWGEFSIAAWILLIGLTLFLYYNFLNIPLAIYQKYREKNRMESPGYFPPITILIPAFNEEKVLARTIQAVIESPYPDKEILVIDDGSTDLTYQIATSFQDQGVKVIHRPNGGKAVALNHGLLFTRGDIIVVVDADSQIGKSALVELIKPFRNPEVAAVAGNIKVINRVNLLTNCQALEYISSINIYRRALDVFGAVTIVPGCCGAYRRDAMKSGGFYDTSTLVEDFDVTIKTLKTHQIVQASSAAISYTEAPRTLKDLIKQRQRWYRGNYQTIWKHRDILFNSRYGFLQRYSFPHMVISMLFLPIGGLVLLGATIMMIVQGDGLVVVPAIIFFCMLQMLLSLFAIQLDGEDKKLVIYSVVCFVFFKPFCDLLMVKSLFDVLTHRKTKLKWTSAKRVGEATTGQQL